VKTITNAILMTVDGISQNIQDLGIADPKSIQMGVDS